jgi:hypothetical protein
MPSSGMLRHVALVRNDVSEERIVSIITVTTISELGMLCCHPDGGGDKSSKTLVLTRAAWRNIPEDGNLHGSRSENLKSYEEILCSRKKSSPNSSHAACCVVTMLACIKESQ